MLGGALLDGAARAFAGSSTYIPKKVYCMRVNAGSQAAAEFKSGGDVILKATSADWGSHANQIKRRLKKAADGAYTALVSYSGSEEEATEIGKDSVSILYIGTGTGADCTVNATHRCFSLGKKVQSVSREVGFSRSSIYKWKRKRLEGYKQMKAEKKKAAKSGKRKLTETEKDKREA